MANIEFASLQKTGQVTAPESNYGGLQKYIYIGFMEDLDTIPSRTIVANNPSSRSSTAVQPAMKSGKYMTKFHVDFESPQMTNDSNTTTPRFNAFTTKIDVYTVGFDDATVGLIEALLNQDLFVIVKDFNGNMFFVGQDGQPAGIMTEGLGHQTGTIQNGENRFAFSIYTRPKPILKYTGTPFNPDTFLAP